mmetsp:Transcript_140275/g.247921  ORF Transcript_140275/g.247921 Transcript_140275/m.247921 type:complete len:110 (-) Transcript_140275:110-439(-)
MEQILMPKTTMNGRPWTEQSCLYLERACWTIKMPSWGVIYPKARQNGTVMSLTTQGQVKPSPRRSSKFRSSSKDNYEWTPHGEKSQVCKSLLEDHGAKSGRDLPEGVPE